MAPENSFTKPSDSSSSTRPSTEFRVLGIDPGLSGSLVLYSPVRGELQACRDFTDLNQLARQCHQFAHLADFAILEYVASRPGQGVSSTFSFGRATGIVMGALNIVGKPWIEVTPQTWQRWVREYLGVPRSQPLESRDAARHLFPDKYERLWRRMKDHNTADAALLALWGACNAHLGPKTAGEGPWKSLPPIV